MESLSVTQTRERQTENRTSVRQALWEAHMKSPTAVLEEALGRTEEESEMVPFLTARSSDA